METLDNLPLKLKESIEKIIEKEKFTSYDVKVKNLTSNGNTYSYLCEINVIGKINDVDREINIFAKSLLSNKDLQIFSVTLVYDRERYVYNELMKVFNELQNEANLSEDKRFEIVKSFDGTNKENIILDNLAMKGYKVYYKMDVMRLEYTTLAVKELAKLHGLSFALENRRPEYFEKKIKTIEQPFYFNKNWDELVRNIFQVSVQYLSDDVKERYEEKLWEIVNKYPVYMTDRSSVCTFVHGDYKHNNVMVKETNSAPTKVAVIDYQIMHYGSPLNDLLYLIFNGTDQDFRRNHLTYLKDIYHDTMKEFLRYFSIDIEDIFPRELFDRLFREKLDFGLGIQFFYIPFLFASDDNVPDVTDDLGAISFKIDNKFGPRLRGVVDDFINWGYL